MMTNNDLIIQSRKEILINNEPKKAINILNDIKDINDPKLFYNSLALAYLENKEYTKAAEIYTKINEKYQAGYCELLAGNAAEAENLWYSAPDSPLCRWGKCLLDFIKARKSSIPTYLQIRNNLETDLGYLIQANQHLYAENLMKCEDVLIAINLETYKLFGKVMMNFGYMNLARKYFLKSMEIIPFDAENHYYMALYNNQSGLHDESIDSLKKCLNYNPSHIPAKKLLNHLEIHFAD